MLCVRTCESTETFYIIMQSIFDKDLFSKMKLLLAYKRLFLFIHVFMVYNQKYYVGQKMDIWKK